MTQADMSQGIAASGAQASGAPSCSADTNAVGLHAERRRLVSQDSSGRA